MFEKSNYMQGNKIVLKESGYYFDRRMNCLVQTCLLGRLTVSNKRILEVFQLSLNSEIETCLVGRLTKWNEIIIAPS